MKIVIGFLFAFLCYKGILSFYQKMWNKGLDASVSFEKSVCIEGDNNILIEVVQNGKFLPLPVLKVCFFTDRSLSLGKKNVSQSDKNYRADVFTMLPYQKITRRLPFVCKRRGFFSINEVTLIASDAFMAQNFNEAFEINPTLLVYPKGVDYKELEVPFSKMMGSVISRRSSYQDPFEFRSIRPYQSFDSMKDINWKASAKTGELLVNAHNFTVEQEVVLLLNLNCNTALDDFDLKEEALQIASTLAGMFIEKGVSVSLYTNGRDQITGEEPVINTGSGAEHVLSIREALARIDFSKPQREFYENLNDLSNKVSENAVPIMITPSASKKTVEEYSKIFKKGGVWMLTHRPGKAPEIEVGEDTEVIYWKTAY